MPSTLVLPFFQAHCSVCICCIFDIGCRCSRASPKPHQRRIIGDTDPSWFPRHIRWRARSLIEGRVEGSFPNRSRCHGVQAGARPAGCSGEIAGGAAGLRTLRTIANG